MIRILFHKNNILKKNAKKNNISRNLFAQSIGFLETNPLYFGPITINGVCK
jgi:hypothetical protein